MAHFATTLDYVIDYCTCTSVVAQSINRFHQQPGASSQTKLEIVSAQGALVPAPPVPSPGTANQPEMGTNAAPTGRTQSSVLAHPSAVAHRHQRETRAYVKAVQFVHASTPKEATALSSAVPASETHAPSGCTADVQVPPKPVSVQSVTPPRVRFCGRRSAGAVEGVRGAYGGGDALSHGDDERDGGRESGEVHCWLYDLMIGVR